MENVDINNIEVYDGVAIIEAPPIDRLCTWIRELIIIPDHMVGGRLRFDLRVHHQYMLYHLDQLTYPMSVRAKRCRMACMMALSLLLNIAIVVTVRDWHLGLVLLVLLGYKFILYHACITPTVFKIVSFCIIGLCYGVLGFVAAAIFGDVYGAVMMFNMFVVTEYCVFTRTHRHVEYFRYF